MIERKKKLRITQIILLILGLIIILFTYTGKKNYSGEEIIPKETQEKIDKQLTENNSKGDIFYNISYSGLDLSGNRFILKSKEAFNQNSNQDLVNMKYVEAIFYFKDNTTLEVFSDKGLYNNKTLDMNFEGNVTAFYQDSELFAEKAEYSNTNAFLTVMENVKIKDIRGTMVADKLLFDIKNQTLNIASFNNDKINANINLK